MPTVLHVTCPHQLQAYILHGKITLILSPARKAWYFYACRCGNGTLPIALACMPYLCYRADYVWVPKKERKNRHFSLTHLELGSSFFSGCVGCSIETIVDSNPMQLLLWSAKSISKYFTVGTCNTEGKIHQSKVCASIWQKNISRGDKDNCRAVWQLVLKTRFVQTKIHSS